VGASESLESSRNSSEATTPTTCGLGHTGYFDRSSRAAGSQTSRTELVMISSGSCSCGWRSRRTTNRCSWSDRLRDPRRTSASLSIFNSVSVYMIDPVSHEYVFNTQQQRHGDDLLRRPVGHLPASSFWHRRDDRLRRAAVEPEEPAAGAAAQVGIFVTFLAPSTGFSPQSAASIGIIGGADGPTAIFTAAGSRPRSSPSPSRVQLHGDVRSSSRHHKLLTSRRSA